MPLKLRFYKVIVYFIFRQQLYNYFSYCLLILSNNSDIIENSVNKLYNYENGIPYQV